MTRATTHNATRELAYRATDGLEVALLWHERENVVSVAVLDSKTGDSFELVLGDDENALAAFHHPYGYAAHKGIKLRPPPARARSRSGSISEDASRLSLLAQRAADRLPSGFMRQTPARFQIRQREHPAAHPVGGRRKLQQVPGNPRKPSGEKSSHRKSPLTPAQPGTTKTGLSRRRSRVRVPSLPLFSPVDQAVVSPRMLRLQFDKPCWVLLEPRVS